MHSIQSLALRVVAICCVLLALPKASAGSLTLGEQAALLQSSGLAGYRVSSATKVASRIDPIADIERTIQRANRGGGASSLHRPVSRSAIRRLQLRFALRGQHIPLSQMETMVDYGQALMRESSGKVALSEKVAKLPKQLRKPFHGNVAEFAEARARGMVLTRSRTATTWDLTEGRVQPRNYQMKIFARNSRALSSLIEDLSAKTDYVKRGITTQRTLDWGLRNNRLVRNGEYYSPPGRRDIKLEASKKFSRPAISRLYARTGRSGLIEAASSNGFRAGMSDSLVQSSSRWLGRLGIAAMVTTEAYAVHGLYTGRMSRRDFVTTNVEMAGSLAGGAAGAYAGAFAGPAGMILGGIAGGVLGYMGSEKVTGDFYARVDEKQRKQLDALVYQRYGLTP